MGTVRSKLYEGLKLGNAGDGSGGDAAFNGSRPISRQTPGLVGVNPGATTVIEMLENVFYPAIAPIAALSFNNPIREIGADPAYVLTWAATKQTNNITGITVDGNVIAPTGASQGGTQSGDLTGTTGTYSKSMTVTDGTLSDTESATVTYLPRMFWGNTSKTAGITDADILALSGSELRSDRLKSYTNIGGDGEYLLFAFPSSFGTPSFVINGLANTAFTKIRSASNFVNAEGATIVMDVWISDNFYSSPLASLIIN
ncbi:hypothetical protein IDJ77_11190 [Mucilaginibacter sp. ZT4R22]|uniref:Uncharacterized protein n=1 Tax=Mucilaginibacter pankratovii TaxID=2772110 RepID=A0ABR7WPX2_9SPHI|nr:hypothetical protein [Mucilaginibacter pankratovii]MBD1364373.1 hypothetical protein [Mucilaginibacter pankratovii]